MANETLWCVNIKGPDDIISAPDHLSAVRMANTFNAWWLDLITKAPLTDNHPRMWAEPIEWPYSEGHGEDVTDPNNEYHWLRELTALAPSPRAQALEEAAQGELIDRLLAMRDQVMRGKRCMSVNGSAVIALAERVLPGCRGDVEFGKPDDEGLYCARIYLTDRAFKDFHKVPAIALCIAILRTKEALR